MMGAEMSQISWVQKMKNEEWFVKERMFELNSDLNFKENVLKTFQDFDQRIFSYKNF